jgi:hypothetical protein
MPEPFTNARAHEWLAEAIDAATTEMHANRLQLNSAALWWFLNKLTPEQRAEVLGEYVEALALAGQERAQADGRAGGKGKGKRTKK